MADPGQPGPETAVAMLRDITEAVAEVVERLLGLPDEEGPR